jgi:hypothetical protein
MWQPVSIRIRTPTVRLVHSQLYLYFLGWFWMWGRTTCSFCITEFKYAMRWRDHFKWVRCHHGMARPQVADGGDGLEIWWVAANILNKPSRTANRGWSSSLGVGRGTKNPRNIYTRASDQEGFFGKTTLAPKNGWGGQVMWHEWERGETCTGF